MNDISGHKMIKAGFYFGIGLLCAELFYGTVVKFVKSHKKEEKNEK